MKIHSDTVALSVLLLCAWTARADAPPPMSLNESDACSVFAQQDFTRIPDASTKILAARVLESSAESHCEVTGYVSKNVSFLLRLPLANWNGKFLQMGCGGTCGTITEIAASTGDFSVCTEGVRRGYACLVTDNGHSGGGYLWAYNNPQAEIDHAYRATHVVALAGKALTTAFYNREPALSYFWGCSTGGRLGLMEAQRFPEDFDGIIAGCPTIGVPAFAITALWNHRALMDTVGSPVISPAQVEVLHREVIAQCDGDDGVADGIIGDPRTCNVDPRKLLCTSRERTGCLTELQLGAVHKVYAGPRTSDGRQIYFPGPMKGSERSWLTAFSSDLADVFRYSSFDIDPGPDWDSGQFDFDQDAGRIQLQQALFAPVNPDLRQFKAAGGKLIAYVGWNDAVGVPLSGVDYYEITERTMGGRNATQEFFRLFAVPGMDHCGGGIGAFAVDWLGALEQWVEQGQAPTVLVSAHVKLQAPVDSAEAQLEAKRQRFPLDPARVEFSRPLYPYPLRAKYLGHGDPRNASSFGPAEP